MKFTKRFFNVIVKLGGLHLVLNMLRSFVSLNWKIDYSFIVMSPKAQIFQQKVQDLHKAFDTFIARRKAKLLEYVRPFVLDCIKRNKESTPEYFEQWVANEVKDLSYKLNSNIDKYLGTSICLVKAEHRA